MSVSRKIETESDLKHHIALHRALVLSEFMGVLFVIAASTVATPKWPMLFTLSLITISAVWLFHMVYFGAVKEQLEKASESSMIGVAKDVCAYTDLKEELCSVLKVRDFLTVRELRYFRAAVIIRQQLEVAEQDDQRVHNEWESVKNSMRGVGDC